VTVYVVVVVSTPVSNDPLVPVPPPPEDLQNVLLVELQEIVALSPEARVVELEVLTPAASECEVMLREISGRPSTTVTEPPPPPPHEARPNTNKIPRIRSHRRVFEPIFILPIIFIPQLRKQDWFASYAPYKLHSMTS